MGGTRRKNLRLTKPSNTQRITAQEETEQNPSEITYKTMGKKAKAQLSAKAALADFALSGLEKALAVEKPSLQSLELAIATLQLIRWEPETFRELGTKRCNNVLAALRNLKFPTAKYRELSANFKMGIREIEDKIPTNWATWAPVFRKYRLQQTIGWDGLIAITGSLETYGIQSPLELALFTKTNMMTTAATIGGPSGFESIWMATRCFVEEAELVDWGTAMIPAQSAADLIPDLRSKVLDDAPISRKRGEIAALIGLPENFDELKPSAKTTALATCGAPDHLVTDFLDLSARINVLRSVKGSLRCVASGLNSYLRFCALLLIPAFPVTPASARRWSAVFHPGKTYAQYVSHLRKACILLQHPTSWFTEEIKTISKGLRNAQDKTFVFPNFLGAADVLRIIRYEGQLAPMAVVAYLSYLFSLRVPSETLRLEKASTQDQLLSFEPQGPKALIGLQWMKETPVLAIKFRFRKNIRGGCILIRPCLCRIEDGNVRALCPIHGFWNAFQAVAPAYGPILPTLSANSVNRQLKAIMTALGYLRPHKYSSHAFRRGATQEIFASGSTLATIAKSGGWSAGGFRGYLDLQADEAANISALLLSAATSDSEDSDADLPAARQSIRNKLPTFPLILEPGPSRGLTHPERKPKPTSDTESSVISETSESESIEWNPLS